MALITAAEVTARATAKSITIPSYYTDNTNAKLTAAITTAQKYIEQVTGNIFDEQTFTQKWSGQVNNLTNSIQTDYFPITSVTSLTVDSTAKTADKDFYVTDAESGIIHTDFYLPTSGFNNVVLVYKAGYNPSHPTVAEICMNMVLDLVQTDPTGEKISKFSDEGFSVEYANNSETQDLLKPFRRRIIGIIMG